MPFVVRPMLATWWRWRGTRRQTSSCRGVVGEAEPFARCMARGKAGADPQGASRRTDAHDQLLPAVRVRRWVGRSEIDRYDPQHLSFFNVNTPEDLEQARRWQAPHELDRDGDRRADSAEELYRMGAPPCATGERERGRQMLLQAVDYDRNHSEAWLWLSATTTTLKSSRATWSGPSPPTPQRRRQAAGWGC